MKTTRRSLAALCFCAPWIGAVAGCVGTETGNPPPRVTVQFQTQSSDEQRVSVGDGPGISLSEIRIAVDSISVRSDCFEATESVTVTEGSDQIVLDLVRDRDEFEILSDDACSLDVRLTPADLGWDAIRSGVESELSLGISGTTSSGQPLFVESKAPLEASFHVPAYSSGSRFALVLDVASLFDFEEIGSLEANSKGEFIICENGNEAALNALHQRWAPSWSFSVLQEGQSPVALSPGSSK